jgi:hypothetical protein
MPITENSESHPVDFEADQSGPECETVYRCQKFDIDISRENPVCRDPKLYCKFRPHCTIWYLWKNGE